VIISGTRAVTAVTANFRLTQAWNAMTDMLKLQPRRAVPRRRDAAYAAGASLGVPVPSASESGLKNVKFLGNCVLHVSELNSEVCLQQIFDELARN
jgi:hypothetical protein